MRTLLMTLVLLLVSVGAHAQIQARECVRWQTITNHDQWGRSHTETHCTRWEQIPQQRIIQQHHYHNQPSRGNDNLLLGALIGAGVYHIIDRNRDRDRRHRRLYQTVPHCYQTHQGWWRCRD